LCGIYNRILRLRGYSFDHRSSPSRDSLR
jgi:hypothetical protein